MKNSEALELADEWLAKATSKDPAGAAKILHRLKAAGWRVVLRPNPVGDLNNYALSIESIYGPACHIFHGCWEGDLNSKQWAGIESIPQKMYDDYLASLPPELGFGALLAAKQTAQN